MQDSGDGVLSHRGRNLPPLEVRCRSGLERRRRKVLPNINLLRFSQTSRMNAKPAQHAGSTDAAVPPVPINTGLPVLLSARASMLP